MSCGCQGAGACDCCAGIDFRTPVEVDNRPGLSALAWRVGTHGRFKASMLAGISAKKALAALTTRRDDDLTVALLDGWATVLDVLTFYQERIANEGFLRTAAERRSILELARAIGYELGPGVAASTWLAFTLDDTAQAPRSLLLDVGTRAQSLPGKDELPQTFETTSTVEARPAWNALRPREEEPQLLISPIDRVELAGTGLGLAAGDALLAVHGSQRQAFRVTAAGELRPAPPAAGPGRTVVDLEPLDPSAAALEIGIVGLPVALSPEPTGPEPLTGQNVAKYLLGASWTADELAARAEVLAWPLDELAAHLDDVEFPEIDPGVDFHAFRVKTRPFGHNGMLHGTLPKEWREKNAPYDTSWDPEGVDVNRDSQGVFHDPSQWVIYLDGEQKEVLAGSWLLLREAGTRITRSYLVEAVEEESRADYGITGRATRVTLGTASDLDEFQARNTTVWGASERLELAPVAIAGDVHGGGLALAGLAVGLVLGRRVVVEGERADLPGVVAAELRKLATVHHSLVEGRTVLGFDEPLDHRYLRSTVRLTANVAPATHGESRSEVLGSGSAAVPFQRFTLKGKPPTYTSAPVPSGGLSTLEVRVDGVEWHEAPDLYRLGPDDRAYVLRRDDDGTTSVLFGDGVHGARLPTGTENVTATYRVGVGLGGQVAAGRVNLLASQPLGVRGVVNPVAASGAEDPERLDGARRNAPLTVLTLDRIVSLRDFQDFARAFGGIGKARADRVWNGRERVVFVTVAGADGQPIPADAQVLVDLRAAMDRFREPFQAFGLGTHTALHFRLEAALVIDPDHEAEAVLAAAGEALTSGFAFAARELAQPVAASDVVLALQGVPGVVAVDLDVLELAPAGGGAVHGRLTARPARRAAPGPASPEARPIRGAELLTLAPGGAELRQRAR
jgi:hypothetical protein